MAPLLGGPRSSGPRFIEPPEPPVPTPLDISGLGGEVCALVSAVLVAACCRRRRVRARNPQLRRGARLSQHRRIVPLRSARLSARISPRLPHWQLRPDHLPSRTPAGRSRKLRRYAKIGFGRAISNVRRRKGKKR